MQETSAVYDALGIDTDDLEWQDLAMCKGAPLEEHYEKYESDPRTAKQVDQRCFSCIVRTQCLAAGVENNEYGVWGGVFLTAGRADENKNSHKTPADWKRIREEM